MNQRTGRIGTHWTTVRIMKLNQMSKSRLVELLANGIVGPDSHYRRSLTPPKQLAKWSKDELIAAVRDMVQ